MGSHLGHRRRGGLQGSDGTERWDKLLLICTGSAVVRCWRRGEEHQLTSILVGLSSNRCKEEIGSVRVPTSPCGTHQCRTEEDDELDLKTRTCWSRPLRIRTVRYKPVWHQVRRTSEAALNKGIVIDAVGGRRWEIEERKHRQITRIKRNVGKTFKYKRICRMVDQVTRLLHKLLRDHPLEQLWNNWQIQSIRFTVGQIQVFFKCDWHPC